MLQYIKCFIKKIRGFRGAGAVLKLGPAGGARCKNQKLPAGRAGRGLKIDIAGGLRVIFFNPRTPLV